MGGSGAHHLVLSIFHGPFTTSDLWIVIGFLGQTLFFMRFLIQWIASEKQGRSVMPDVFWHFSLAGGLVLLAYAVYRQDPVFIMGQGIGLFVYMRNLMLVRRTRALEKGV